MLERSNPWSPWQELERLRGEMNRLLGDMWRPGFIRRSETPPMNVWRRGEALVVTAEIPGVEPDDLDISVVGDTLTVRGERKAEPVGEDVRPLRQERAVGAFSRTLRLPFEVDPDRTEATYEKGVLTITLLPPEKEAPRKVTVKSA